MKSFIVILTLLLFNMRPAPKLIPRDEKMLTLQWFAEWGPANGYLTPWCTVEFRTIREKYPRTYLAIVKCYDRETVELKSMHFYVVGGGEPIQ